MREPYEILVKPLVSEKSMLLMGENKYSFAVAKDANKIEIKHAVEKMFNVTVLSVNTRTIQGKVKRQGRYEGKRADVKKAIVTLKAGDQIIIAALDYDYAMSTTQNTNNRAAVDVTKSADNLYVTFGSDVQIITLEAGATVTDGHKDCCKSDVGFKHLVCKVYNRCFVLWVFCHSVVFQKSFKTGNHFISLSHRILIGI